MKTWDILGLPWHKEIFVYLQKVRMNRYEWKSLSFALGSLVVGMGLGSANPTFADANTDLSTAKMAIAQNDYRTASLLLKQVFLDSLDGSEEDEQALKLIDEIYTKTNGRAIPVDYELPAELQGLKIRFIRRFQRPDDHPGGPSGGHRVSIAIEAPYNLRYELRPGIGDLALFKEPSGKMLIDSSDARQWGGDVESDRSYIGNDFSDHQDMDGLYRLGIDIYKPTHQQFSAWFIVTRAKAWGDPVISSPGNIPRVTPPDEAPRNPRTYFFNSTISYHLVIFRSSRVTSWRTSIFTSVGATILTLARIGKPTSRIRTSRSSSRVATTGQQSLIRASIDSLSIFRSCGRSDHFSLAVKLRRSCDSS
jgi:hypothetical protein